MLQATTPTNISSRTTRTTKKKTKTEEEKEEKEEEEVQWLYTKKQVLPVERFSRVYTSAAQMNEAVRRNRFDLNRTMALKNGKLYFLCYE